VSSRFSGQPDRWDLVFETDPPLKLMLVRSGDTAAWQGTDAPALATQPSSTREQAVQFKNNGLGAGFSIRTPEATGQGVDGQILSNGYSYGEFVTSVVDGILMPAGKLTEVDLPPQVAALSGRIFDAAEYGDDLDLYFTTGTRYLVKIPSGDGVPVLGQDLGSGFASANITPFDGTLWVSGSGGPIWGFTEAGGWGQAATVTRSRLATVYWTPSNQLMGGSGGGTGAERLIGTDASGIGFFHCSAGDSPFLAVDWVSVGGDPIPVGDPHYPIQNIVASPDVVWFAKPNGLHGVNEVGRTLNLTRWFERTYDGSNGGCVQYFTGANQSLAFIAHREGLVAVTLNGEQQDTANFVNFGASGPNQTPIAGRPRWFTPTADGLFVAYFDGTDSYIMRLVLKTDGSYRWSGPECVIRGEEVTFLRVTSPGGLPRLWIGTIDNTGELTAPLHLYWQSLPVYGNPYIDWTIGTAHRFADEWAVYVPRDDFGSSAEKVLRRYDIVAKNLAAGGGSVAVYASADDGAYVLQGAASASPRSSFLATTYTEGVNFNWRLSVTGSETQPVILEAFQARASVIPEHAPIWNFPCDITPGIATRDGGEDTEDPFTKWVRVRGLQRQGPVQMRSPLSRQSVTVKVEQPGPIQLTWDDAREQYGMQMLVTVSVLRMPPLYDAGYPFDSGVEYG
jgi:hypothetical protein